MMETRLAVLGIIVEDLNQTTKMNSLISEYREYIVGRMGLPYDRKNVSVISLVLDAPADKISALAGKLGQLSGITAKAVYSKK